MPTHIDAYIYMNIYAHACTHVYGHDVHIHTCKHHTQGGVALVFVAHVWGDATIGFLVTVCACVRMRIHLRAHS